MIHHGDAITVLRTLPEASVDCCVTSPPYFGLRDYGVDGQIGLEKTPTEYIAKLMAVFAEVRRILTSSGTCWINIGDSYANDGKWGGHTGGKHVKVLHCSPIGRMKRYTGLKPKDLIGIPWMLAFALRDDGWYLRQDIIWAKPNPMPESVKDRCTKAHEYLFLLSKSPRYFWDTKAMQEPAQYVSANAPGKIKSPYAQNLARRPSESGSSFRRENSKRGVAHVNSSNGTHRPGREDVSYNGPTRNKRSVWTIATLPTPDAHFATFPIGLAECCILAGCPVGGIVLDPFAGAGTAGLAAIKNGRKFVGIELNADYITMAEKRLRDKMPLLAVTA